MIDSIYRYEPIGACIYCGSDENLTDEHIVPFGLSGRWLLPKSSCRRCAAITSSFEAYCLRNMLILPRLKFNMKSRRPKKLPKKLNAGIAHSDKYEIRPLDIDEYPISLMLPSFQAPRALLGQSPIEGIHADAFSLFFNEKWEKNKDIFGSGTSFHGEFEVSAFCRMLSKIAYGFAVAEGACSQRTESPLVDVILGLTPYTCHFVGCLPEVSIRHRPDLHQLELSELDGWIICSVRLFASQGAHSYTILVQRSCNAVDLPAH